MKSWIKYIFATLAILVSGMSVLNAQARRDVSNASFSDMVLHAEISGVNLTSVQPDYYLHMIPDGGKHLEIAAEILESEEEIHHSKLQAAAKVFFQVAFYTLIFGYLTFFFVENIPALYRTFAPAEGRRFLLLEVFRL